MRAGSASVMLEGIAGSGEAARQAGGTGRCALLTGSVAAPAARLLVRSEVLALKSAHSGGCVRAVLFRGGARCDALMLMMRQMKERMKRGRMKTK